MRYFQMFKGTVQQTRFFSYRYPIKHHRYFKTKSGNFRFWLRIHEDIRIRKLTPRSKQLRGVNMLTLGNPFLSFKFILLGSTSHP